mmetsp:Transcript_13544/g.47176  ORF Transcript_13544/g.47176 Transcript_13544/m.47176 type:complete len:222 (+) Transcript_13544:2351-3016(+)
MVGAVFVATTAPLEATCRTRRFPILSPAPAASRSSPSPVYAPSHCCSCGSCAWRSDDARCHSSRVTSRFCFVRRCTTLARRTAAPSGTAALVAMATRVVGVTASILRGSVSSRTEATCQPHCSASSLRLPTSCHISHARCRRCCCSVSVRLTSQSGTSMALPSCASSRRSRTTARKRSRWSTATPTATSPVSASTVCLPMRCWCSRAATSVCFLPTTSSYW